MKIIIGFIFGLMIASAMADWNPLRVSIGATLAAGTSPDHHATPIQTDNDEYVICSTEHKP